MTLAARSDAIVGPKANAYDAKTVLFMLSTVAVWFGIINAAREIAKESAVLRRERLAGLSVLAYVLSKVLVMALLVAIGLFLTVHRWADRGDRKLAVARRGPDLARFR